MTTGGTTSHGGGTGERTGSGGGMGTWRLDSSWREEEQVLKKEITTGRSGAFAICE